MSYFSRLTEIVTCNLDELLAREADPRQALQAIIAEMQEGLSGAKRSAATAAAGEERLQRELSDCRRQREQCVAEAKRELAAGREIEARAALTRKQELEDVAAGLDQEHQAALTTRTHLETTLRALQARVAEAHRKFQALADGPAAQGAAALPRSQSVTEIEAVRARRVEDELAALKRELGHGR